MKNDNHNLGQFKYFRSPHDGWTFYAPNIPNSTIFVENSTLNNEEELRALLSKTDLAKDLLGELTPLPSQFLMSHKEIEIRKAVSEIESDIEAILSQGLDSNDFWYAYDRFMAIAETAGRFKR